MIEAVEEGLDIQMNEYPQMPRRVNAIGMMTGDGTLSAIVPSSGSSRIVPIVAVRIIFWYKSFDSSSFIRPSSTKLVIHRSKKFENKTAIKRMIAAPKKQTMYLASLQHSVHTFFVSCLILAKPFASSSIG